MDAKLRVNTNLSPGDSCTDPLTPMSGPTLDLGDRDTLERLITENYAYLVNRINPRDFCPYLRQERGLSLADQQEITHMVTSVDKASHLLDLVLRKDLRCLEAFFEVLEYSYEECYAKMTGLAPRPPPESWAGTGPSQMEVMRSSMVQLERCMLSMTEILNQISTNRIQMDKLQKEIKNVSHTDEAFEGKEDIIKLKDRIGLLKKENVELSIDNQEMRRRVDRERAKSKKLTDLETKVVQLRQEIREKEEEYKKLKTAQLIKGVVMAMTPDNKIRLDDFNVQVDKLTKQLIESEAELRLEQEEKKKLNMEIEDLEKLNIRRNEDNNRLQEHIKLLNTKVEELEHKCYWMERTNNRGTTLLSRRDTTFRLPAKVPLKDGLYSVVGRAPPNFGDPLYDQCPITGDDQADEERMIPFVTSSDEEDEGASAGQTSEKHRVELRHKDTREALQKRIDRLSVTLSKVAYVPQVSIEEEPKGYYTTPDIKFSELLSSAKKISQKYQQMRTSILALEMEASFLEQNVKIAGGNHAGIFVTEVGNDVTLQKGKRMVQKGDQLIKVRKVGRDESSTMCLGDCTLEEAHSILRSLSGPVELYTWSRQDAFHNFQFQSQLNTDYRGDMFCIYIYNQPTNTDKIQGYLHVNTGDILLITDTMCSDQFLWKARKLNPVTGEQMDPLNQGYIPSISQTNAGSIVRRGQRSLGNPKTTTRQKIYTYVQPYKANFLRPMILCGQDSIVERVAKAMKSDTELELLQKEDNQVSKMSEKISEMRKKRIVLIQQHQLIPSMIKHNIYPIVIVLDCPTMPNEKSSTGKRADEDLKKGVPTYLVEVVDVTSDKLMKGEQLLVEVKDKVTKVQDQIVWMEKDRPCMPVMT